MRSLATRPAKSDDAPDVEPLDLMARVVDSHTLDIGKTYDFALGGLPVVELIPGQYVRVVIHPLKVIDGGTLGT